MLRPGNREGNTKPAQRRRPRPRRSGVPAHELADVRADALAPAAARKNPVMTDPWHEQVLTFAGRDAGAKRMRGLGLAVARYVVQLAFYGEQSRALDRLRPDRLAPDAPGAPGQAVLLEHRPYGVEIVLGGHVEDGVVLVVEGAVRLGRFAVALDQVVVEI